MPTPNLNNPALVLTPGILYSGQLGSTAETAVLTAPANTAVKVASMSVANISGAAVTVTVSVTKSGQSADATHRVVNAFSLAASDDFVVDEVKDLMLGDGDAISVKASAAGAIDVVISGVTFG